MQHLSHSVLNTSQREGAAKQSPQNLSVFLRLLPEEGANVTCFSSRSHCHSERSEESRYKPRMRHMLLNIDRREGAAFGGKWWAPFNSCKATLMIKPYNRALGAKRKQANLASLVEMHPYSRFAGLLHGKASHVIFKSLRSLTNHVRLPPH